MLKWSLINQLGSLFPRMPTLQWLPWKRNLVRTWSVGKIRPEETLAHHGSVRCSIMEVCDRVEVGPNNSA